MQRNQKILICCGISLIIIIIYCIIKLIFSSKAQSQIEEVIVKEETVVEEPIEVWNGEPLVNPEQDILNDLESFFAGENGYETLEGEFWFTSEVM